MRSHLAAIKKIEASALKPFLSVTYTFYDVTMNRKCLVYFWALTFAIFPNDCFNVVFNFKDLVMIVHVGERVFQVNSYRAIEDTPFMMLSIVYSKEVHFIEPYCLVNKEQKSTSRIYPNSLKFTDSSISLTLFTENKINNNEVIYTYNKLAAEASGFNEKSFGQILENNVERRSQYFAVFSTYKKISNYNLQNFQSLIGFFKNGYLHSTKIVYLLRNSNIRKKMTDFMKEMNYCKT